MAVPCRRCGREYDVTLFEFGRTISCTCGSRVGVEPRVRSLEATPPRFVADAMLGRLARWLRLLGFDCACEDGIADGELVRQGIVQGRSILTRDRALPEEWWVAGIYLVREEKVGAQLVEVSQRFGLASHVRLLSRCSECNRPLIAVPRSDLAGRVPPRVLQSHAVFSDCPSCGRVYWEGSHAARIRRVAEALAEAPEADLASPGSE